MLTARRATASRWLITALLLVLSLLLLVGLRELLARHLALVLFLKLDPRVLALAGHDDDDRLQENNH